MQCKMCGGGMPCYEHGGDVESMDETSDGSDDLMESVAGELHSALERKDKKAILEALRAICLSCME